MHSILDESFEKEFTKRVFAVPIAGMSQTTMDECMPLLNLAPHPLPLPIEHYASSSTSAPIDSSRTRLATMLIRATDYSTHKDTLHLSLTKLQNELAPDNIHVAFESNDVYVYDKCNVRELVFTLHNP
jgi:hypothetical protein